MVIWSYNLERFDLIADGGHTAVQESLNRLGDEGWEFVGVHAIGEYPYALFKRPVDVGEAAE